MNGINSFIIGFSSSCILLGFLYMLCPSGNMSASVKYIFCLCFVCCIVGSALSIKQPDFSMIEKAQNAEIITEQNASVTAQMIFSEALTQKNINFRKITVDTNKLADGSIVISRITVYTSEPPQKVLEVIKSDSYEVIVINE
ncbi:MAG: hypothetical protein E7521_04420 [Ruminococcaceae bacterium]|nr:hypothetical protein [Oscillospiraceae bacterium]